GAFDALDQNRNRVFSGLDALVDYSATVHDEKTSAQVSLFGGPGEGLPPPRLPRPEDWLPSQRLGEELGAVGFYLSGHPLDEYMGALKRKKITTEAEFMTGPGRTGGAGRIAGTLSARRDRKSARGTRFAFIQFSDPSGLWEVMAFSDVLSENDDLLQPGKNLVCHVQAEVTDEQTRLMLRAVQPVEIVAEDAATVGLEIHIEEPEAFESIRNRLDLVSTEARRQRGEGPVRLIMAIPDLDQEVFVDLPGQYAISAEIRGALKSVPGVAAVAEF
ncbi:MAG: DNA polymerase III subunit alpha, partial [Pseudomonadota bacterium]